MSPYRLSILLTTSLLAAATVALPAVAEPGDRDRSRAMRQIEDREPRGNPRSEAFREARREAREQGRVERSVNIPAPQPRIAASRPDINPNSGQGVIRSVENRPDRSVRRAGELGDNRREAVQQRRENRAANREDWRERSQERTEAVRENRQDRPENARERWRDRNEQVREHRQERNEQVLEQRRDRNEQVREHREGRNERAQDWRRDRRDDSNDKWRDRDRNRNDRWRDSRRHDERERWRHHYRWPNVIIRPSRHYTYRPHWWGQSYFYFDSRYSNYGYDYGSYYRPGYGYFGSRRGSGWATLYPWLRDDAAGRHWVMWNFDDNRNGQLGKEEAREANYEFTNLADRDRDGYLSDREISRGIDELREEYRYSYQYG